MGAVSVGGIWRRERYLGETEATPASEAVFSRGQYPTASSIQKRVRVTCEYLQASDVTSRGKLYIYTAHS